MIEIKKGNISMLDEISEIENECFSVDDRADYDMIAERINAFSNRFWCLFEDSRMVSFVHGMTTDEKNLTDEMYENPSLHKNDGLWQMIFSVATKKSHRGKGYAGTLLKYLEEELRKEGKIGIVLTCKVHMIGYYEKFGFENEGISESTHGGAVWYQMRKSF